MDKRRGDQAEARAQRPKDEPASPPHPQRYQKTQTMSYKDEGRALLYLRLIRDPPEALFAPKHREHIKDARRGREAGESGA
jgi:hypothetical protein